MPDSPRDSAARRAVALGSIEAETLVIVPSPLLYYGVAELLGSTADSVVLLCVECDHKLAELSRKHADTQATRHPRILHVESTDPEIVLRTVQTAYGWSFRRVRIAALNGGYALHRAIYDALLESLTRHNRNHWQNQITLIRMSRLWTRNVFQNLALYRSRTARPGFVTSTPAVVAGAGESLERAVPWLLKYRDKFTLVAVDTAVGSLASCRLSPDVVVIVEGQVANYRDFVSVSTLRSDPDIRIVADLISAPAVLRHFRSKPDFFVSQFASTHLFQRLAEQSLLPPVAPALGSVGVTALHLALTMTAGRVLLTGLDFSYRPGKSHARGSPAHLDQLHAASRVRPVDATPSTFARDATRLKARDSSFVYTDMVLRGYGELVEGYAQTTGRVFDTNRASIIDGVPYLTREELDEFFSSFASRADPATESDAGSVSISAEHVREFLENELQLVNEARSASVSVINRRSVFRSILPNLEPVDYLYLDFPDFSGAPNGDSSFLSRVIASSAYYAGVIRRAISLIRL